MELSEQDISKIKELPVFAPSTLTDIFDLDYITSDTREKYFSEYQYNGIKVPRVSTILHQQFYKEGIIHWCLNITKEEYKRKSEEACYIGTVVHRLIENYLLYRTDLPIDQDIGKTILDQILCSYENFKRWKALIEARGFYIEEIVAIEKQLVCPYYGGTADAIVKINGQYFVIDFKTSKRISPEYLVQVCSYRWIINAGYIPDLPIHIDGVGVIRIGKDHPNAFQDIFLSEHVLIENRMMQNCIDSFSSMLIAYYNNLNLELFYQYGRPRSVSKTTLGGVIP